MEEIVFVYGCDVFFFDRLNFVGNYGGVFVRYLKFMFFGFYGFSESKWE